VKEEIKALLAGIVFLVVLVTVVLTVLWIIGFNLPVWNGWTD
jgi:hypothetical protein